MATVNLTEEQSAIVNHNHGPALVFAVAGATSVTLLVLGAPKKNGSAAAAQARLTAGPSFAGLQGGF